MNTPGEEEGRPPTSGGSSRGDSRRPGAAIIGGLCSVAFLGAALVLQAEGSSILKLPTQWLAAAAVPVLVGLMIGGYIGKLRFPGFEVVAPQLKDAPYVPPGSESPTSKPGTLPAWTQEREKEYESKRMLALVHKYRPSKVHGQDYDVSIYLIRHINSGRTVQASGFKDIVQADFFFGKGWDNQVFTVHNNGGTIGINTSTWGTFLAICRVTFNNGHEPVVLQRYIDAEMAPMITGKS